MNALFVPPGAGIVALVAGAATLFASAPPVPAPSAAPPVVATMRPNAATGAEAENPVVLPPGFASAANPHAALAFSDLSLEDAERLAADASPDLAVAAARVVENVAAVDIAKRQSLPSFTSSYVQTPQGNPPTANVLSRIVTIGLAFDLRDLFSESTGVRVAAATLASSRADALAAVRAERINVIGLYYDALKERALASASDDAYALAARQLEAAKLRYAAGDAPRLDVSRATVVLSKAEADDEQTDAADANATDALHLETGTALGRLERTILAIPPRPPVDMDPQQAVTAALASRPEILSASALVTAARAAGRTAAAGRYPVLTVTPGETAGTDSGVPIGAPSIGAQLTFPLGNLGPGAADADRARVDEATARLALARRTATLEVASSARTLAAAERAAVATSREAASARDALGATQLGYRSGAISSLDVSVAAQSYRTAVADDYAARLELAKAETVLAVQIGG